jgi:hypothetical protein
MSTTTTTRRDVTRMAAILAGELAFVVPQQCDGAGQVLTRAVIGRVESFDYSADTGRYDLDIVGTRAGEPYRATYVFPSNVDIIDWIERIIDL